MNRVIKERQNKVLIYLKIFFIIHFIIDIIIAIPLLLFPEYFLTFMGWKNFDPITTRLVGAAFFGIGIGSYLSRKSTFETFSSLLNLKIAWCFSSIVGIFIYVFTSRKSMPLAIWALNVMFLAFGVLWIYLKYRVKKSTKKDRKTRRNTKLHST